RVLGSAVAGVLPPTIGYFALRAEGSLFVLIAYCLLMDGLLLASTNRRLRLASLSSAGLLALMGALAVFVALDITPVSAFLAWFKLVRTGEAGGTISYMFCADFALFSGLLGGLIILADPLGVLCVYLLVNSFLAAVILESWALALVAAAMAVAFILARTLRGRVRAGRAAILSVTQLITSAALLSLALTPLALRNPIVDGLFSIELEAAVAHVFPGFPFLYNVPGYGHSFSQSDHGGPPVLTSRPVFEVTASPGETLYLRSAVYDTYTGKGWALSEAALETAAQDRFRTASLGSSLGQTQANDASLAVGSPEVAGSHLTHKGQAGTSTIRIRLLIDFLADLPMTLDTRSVRPLHGTLPPLRYGSEATGYLLSVPITRGFVLVESQIGAGRKTPSSTSAGSIHPTGPSSAANPRYLQTGALSPKVVLLSESLKRSSPKSTVEAIRSYLAAHYSYTLDTNPPHGSVSPVEDFLFTSHRGYCVQFATAFTLLARLDGIPARYVTGFLVNLPLESNSTIVTGLSAHAWPEVDLPGEGWTTVEATPPMMPSTFEDPRYYQDFNPSGSAYTLRQLQAVMGSRVPPQAENQTGALSFPYALLSCLAAAAGLLSLALRGLYLLLLPRPAKIRRIVRRAVRRTLSAGLPPPERLGWNTWAESAGRLTERRAVMARSANVIQQLFFGSRRPERRDLRFLRGVLWIVYHSRRRFVPSLHPAGHSVEFVVKSSRRE
ncbi:MAG TPA: transglutaminase domain-containing protein, partial [Spirochaetia bacterium]|nr:transglutaminase domain-containing protein [Spirochaetia bacterium]